MDRMHGIQNTASVAVEYSALVALHVHFDDAHALGQRRREQRVQSPHGHCLRSCVQRGPSGPGACAAIGLGNDAVTPIARVHARQARRVRFADAQRVHHHAAGDVWKLFGNMLKRSREMVQVDRVWLERHHRGVGMQEQRERAEADVGTEVEGNRSRRELGSGDSVKSIFVRGVN